MNTVHVPASSEYDVLIGRGVHDRVGEYARELIRGRKCVLVSGSNTAPLYAPGVRASLEKSGFCVELFVFPAGEESKNDRTLVELLNFAAEKQLSRQDCFLALGGGVTGDLTGLAAALYHRGTACIQLPTSLLAMVDASVGGKTAVDLPAGKNLMGTFTQPKLVLCDTACLATLPAENTAEGWAEIIKYGMLSGMDFTKTDDIGEIVARCVEIKRDFVCADERDEGVRRLLNFGHTPAHAAEKVSGYTLSHGRAVAAGMAVMTRGCCALGLCEKGTEQKLEEMLCRRGLPLRFDFSADELIEAAAFDKKRAGDSFALILPEKFGRCVVSETDGETFSRIVRAGM